MKKLFLGILILAQICNVKAFEIEYSEWSLDYPENVNEILIELEDRYLCYLNKYENVEYLKKEDINDKEYDENDYKYYESEELDSKPEEYSEREITEYDKEISFKSTDAYGFIIEGGREDILFSEIEINTVSGESISFTTNKDYLNDGVIASYYPLTDDIKVSFNKNIDLNNILISFYINKNERGVYIGKLNAVNSENTIITSSDYGIDLCQSSLCKLVFNKNNFKTYNTYSKKVYKYKDKLYKTYNVIKEYNDEYLSSCDDMMIDENSKKTFYRYITNEYLLFDVSGNLVTDSNYCIKSFCRLTYVQHDEEENKNIIPNPKTYDPLYDSIVIFVVSAIVLTYLIVERCRLIKKSNNVESILNKKEII